MKTAIKLTGMALLTALIFPLPSFSGDEAKVIYGDDNRSDYFAAPATRRGLADSVVSLWSAAKVTALPDGSFSLKTKLFGDRLFDYEGGKLCPSEPYREQPVGAHCSGTLVGEDLVMTAGHCIDTQAQCDDTKLVFGFAVMKEGGKAPAAVPAANVYSCKSIVASKLESTVHGKMTLEEAAKKGILLDLDYSIIKLDRKVTGRKPLPINRAGGLAKGTDILVVGHPVGLPVKVADGASVINLRGSEPYFEANLDSYGGNSGSGVFNSRTGLIEGILVRGRTDFVKTPAACYVSNVLEQNASRGEGVTKISLLKGFIPGPGKAVTSEPVNVAPGPITIEAPEKTKVSF